MENIDNNYKLQNDTSIMNELILYFNNMKITYVNLAEDLRNRLNEIYNMAMEKINYNKAQIISLESMIFYEEEKDENGNTYTKTNENYIRQEQSVWQNRTNLIQQKYNQYVEIYNQKMNRIQYFISEMDQAIDNLNQYLQQINLGITNYLAIASYDINDFNKFDALIETTNESSKGFTSEKLELLNQKYLEDFNKAQESTNTEKSDYATKLSNIASEVNGEEEKVQEYLQNLALVGGSYQELRKELNKNAMGRYVEVHHIPPKSVIQLLNKKLSLTTHKESKKFDYSIAIAISKKDHALTASFANSKQSKMFQKQQRELIESGNYKQALINEVHDIQQKFGHKYDRQLEQAIAYFQTLYNLEIFDNEIK